jgi:hypothetical protein
MWAVHDALYEKFKCPEESCGGYFPSNRELKSHQALVHGVWRCTARCSFQTSSADDLEAHVQASDHAVQIPDFNSIDRSPQERRHGEGPKSSKICFQHAMQGKFSIVVETPSFPVDNSTGMGGVVQVGLEGGQGSGRLLDCPAVAACNFRHAYEWGIKEHWEVCLFLLFSDMSDMS